MFLFLTLCAFSLQSTEKEANADKVETILDFNANYQKQMAELNLDYIREDEGNFHSNWTVAHLHLLAGGDAGVDYQEPVTSFNLTS